MLSPFLTNEQLGAIFRCSAKIPQRVKSAPLEPFQAPRNGGRPSILGEQEEARLVEWVRNRSCVGRWVSMREFKLRGIEICLAAIVDLTLKDVD